VILDVRALARAWPKGQQLRAPGRGQLGGRGERSGRPPPRTTAMCAMTAKAIARAVGERKVGIGRVARSRANAAADAFRPPDQMRSPRPAATGSRAKRKDHLNAADNTRSEEQPQSEACWLAPVGRLEAVSHRKWSGRCDRHSEEPE